MGKAIKSGLLILIAVAILMVIIQNYSFIFSKVVVGKILGIERVTQTMAVIGGNIPPAEQLYSFAIAIKADKDGEIFTASSEDRQWAVAKEGFCAEVRFYPYPFWNLEKSDTYFNARLVKLIECKQ